MKGEESDKSVYIRGTEMLSLGATPISVDNSVLSKVVPWAFPCFFFTFKVLIVMSFLDQDDNACCVSCAPRVQLPATDRSSSWHFPNSPVVSAVCCRTGSVFICKITTHNN